MHYLMSGIQWLVYFAVLITILLVLQLCFAASSFNWDLIKQTSVAVVLATTLVSTGFSLPSKDFKLALDQRLISIRELMVLSIALSLVSSLLIIFFALLSYFWGSNFLLWFYGALVLIFLSGAPCFMIQLNNAFAKQMLACCDESLAF